MKKHVIAAAAAAALASAPALADNHAKMVDGPRVHWDYSIWGKPRAITEYLTRLSEWLPERTGGKFTFQLHWGTLSKPRANLDGLKIGAFQSASFCASYYPGKLSAHTGLDLPFLPIGNLFQLRDVTHEYFEHPILRQETEKWNSRFYMSSLLPLYEVVGKGKPPKSLADWKGMRIRALGQQGKAMEKLGAVPTSVPAPEVYGALDRGLLDAVGFAYYAHQAYRTWELGKWFTRGLAVGSIACGSLFNNDAWNELPDQYKALLEDYRDAEVGYPRHIATLMKAEAAAPAFFKSKGLTEIAVDPTERAAFEKVGGKPVWEAWVKQMDGEGYNGRELLDLLLAAAEKYRKSGS